MVTQLLPSPGHINPITLQQSGESQAHPPVVYNFHYHGNSHLQTEARHSMRCPWCSMDCGYLYSLLCHLTLCHPRLTSVYTVSITALCVCLCICVCVSVCKCVCVCMCVYVCVCTCLSMYACVYVGLYICVCVYACVYVSVCVCVCMCVCVCVCACVCVCMCVHDTCII